MPIKNKLYSSAGLLVLLILVFLGVYFSHSILNTLPIASPSLSLNEEKSNTLLPIRIKIPRLDIDAVIEHVGLASDGTMEVPTLPGNTAWFNLGPRPGEVGSAVIDGHSGWRDGKSAVFDYLYKLRTGDKVYIEDENGLVTTFLVYKKQIYKEYESASSVFTSNDEGIYLNLITCSNWDAIERKHSDRLVVFTKKEI